MASEDLYHRLVTEQLPDLDSRVIDGVVANLQVVLGKRSTDDVGVGLYDAIWTAYWATGHGATEVGFPSPPLTLAEPEAISRIRSHTTRSSISAPIARHYDAIIVGAGAGGGVVAQRLADAGKTVLLVERGSLLSVQEIGFDHLRNQRVNIGGHNAGPFEGHPRVAIADGATITVEPWDVRYHANAATVGGGTRVYGGQAWRFHPIDFMMASTYGVPDGSSLADWPIRYEHLAPHYERIEHELGVCGNAAAMTHLPAYARDYPMQPIRGVARTERLQKAADLLGWSTLPPPLAINSVARDGRSACASCSYCVGFACTVDAKNGTQNTFIPRALATDRVTLLTDAMATKIHLADQRASGISFVYEGIEHAVNADVIICSAGAIETARLLLRSGANHHQLGRNLQGHVYVARYGLMSEAIFDGIGPGPTIATNQWLHHNDGIIGGGMLLDDFIALPVAFWKTAGANVDKADAREWMRTYYLKTIELKGPIQEIPSSDARVELDPNVRDRFDQPVARLSGATHPESIRSARFLHQRASEWLEACDAIETWGNAPDRVYLSGGQHQAGTCRMGDDPRTSVVDQYGRVHGYENLIVADTSVHVTNGGVNPFLTAMALADRSVTLLLDRW